MSVSRFKGHLLQKLIKQRRFYATTSTSVNTDYTDTPQYPEILDVSKPEIKRREALTYYETIKAVKTVEEKQIKLNMPKYYGFKCFIFHEDVIPYNNLNLAQYITKTHLILNDQLPNTYQIDEKKINLPNLKHDIEEILLSTHNVYGKSTPNQNLNAKESENFITSVIIQQIHRAILMNLKPNYPHLLQTQVDIDPRVESFWFASLYDQKLVPPDNKDKPIQYTGLPSLTVRSEIPLAPILSMDKIQTGQFDVPSIEYSPHAYGIFTNDRRGVNTPGFWPGDPHQFGLIAYHRRGHLLDRAHIDAMDHEEALHRQGILGSFGWLNAQANLLGFTTFNDITYPLVTQCVITNGQLWSFYMYQLNTMLMHLKYTDDKSKKNICWGTKELKLYEEIQDEKIIGFNEDVLKMLVSFYTNVPLEQEGVELRPFLSAEEKVIADYEDNDKCQWLEREYKFIMSNRPRHHLPYEIYHWEKIYKIDHKTRPMDARRRPFELFIKPWDRTYDDRKPRYIPRKLRPHLKRHIGRDAKEYFP